MSDETKDQDAKSTAATADQSAEASEQAAQQAQEPDNGPKPITIELDDLTAEAKAEAEKQLRRSIPDYPYTIQSQENKPGVIVELRVEVPADAYRQEQQVLLNDLRKEIVLPGFRKGKAPVALILKRLGEEAARDTVASIATNVLRQEHAKQQWSMLSKPRVREYTVPAGDDPLVLLIEIEQTPTVELKEYTGFEVEVERRDVTDAMIGERIEQLRQQNAVLEPVAEDHGVAEGDSLVVDVDVTSDSGERLEHLCRSDWNVRDWKHGLPQEIADQIEGKKVGDAVSARVRSKTTNRRGEEIFHEDNYTVTIRQIKALRLPEVDDEFARDLGEYESLDDLRTKLRKQLEEAEESRRKNEALGSIMQNILEKNPFDVPKSLVAREQYELIMQDSYQMQRYGLRLDQVVSDVDKYLSDQQASAEQRVRTQLVLAELRKAEKLEVTDEDVEREIARIAEETGRKPLAVRARLEAQNGLDEFRMSIANRKVADFLLEKNAIKLVEPKPEAEAAEAESEEKPAKSKKN